jgi:hypothetical protein
VPGTPYTLVTFGSTDFESADFTTTEFAGFIGGIRVGSTSLEFIAVTDGPSAQFDLWALLSGLPDGQRGFEDNPSGDSIPNGLKFYLGLDGLSFSLQGITPTTVEVGGIVYPAITFHRRENLGGVIGGVQVASNLGFTPDLGSEEVSTVSQGDGTELVTVRSLVSLASQPDQFFRVTATLPAE